MLEREMQDAYEKSRQAECVCFEYIKNDKHEKGIRSLE